MSLLHELVARSPKAVGGSSEPPMSSEQLESFGRFLAGRDDLRLSLGHHRPSARLDLCEVRLPALDPLPPVFHRRAAFFLRGFLIHECGHIALTREPALFAVYRGMPSVATPLLAQASRSLARWGRRWGFLAELAEEVRIDLGMMRRFPGLAGYHQRFLEEATLSPSGPAAALADSPALAQLGGAVLLLGRGVCDAADLPPAIGAFVGALDGVFGRLREIHDEAALISWVDTLFACTQFLARGDGDTPVRAFARAVFQEPCEGLHVPGHFESDEGADGMRGAEQEAPAPPNPARARRATIVGGRSEGGAMAWATSGAESSGEREQGEASGVRLTVRRAREAPAPTRRASSHPPVREVHYASAERRLLDAAFRSQARRVGTVSARIIDALTRTLLAEQAGGIVGGRRWGRRLDPRALSDIALGADRDDVWMDLDDRSELRAAVCLLVDCSGSMRLSEQASGPSRAAIARDCAMALHLALAPAGVPHAILGFTTYEDAAAGSRRHGPLHRVFKEYDGDARAVMQIAAEKENLDGVAVESAARSLLTREERRKVLLVLSDGHPEGGGDPLYEAARLRLAVREAEEAGVVVVGLGVATRAVERYYRRAVCVGALEELPTALLTATQAGIAGG